LNAAPATSNNSSQLAFLVLGRLVPLVFFALLLVVQAELVGPDVVAAFQRFPDADSALLAANRVLSVLFVGGIALIYLVRKPPAGKLHQPLAVVISFYASFILLALLPVQGLLGIGAAHPTGPVLLTSAVLALAGLAFSVYSLAHLRLSFSIMPEARDLVTGGPYKLVRHPIYLGELITALGIVIGVMTWFALAVWLSMVIAELLRTRYEEDVLRQAFPEYKTYSRTAKRLIPWLL
jgi:protein-S-isoprenylcysteine O-methyltransferase Ste14